VSQEIVSVERAAEYMNIPAEDDEWQQIAVSAPKYVMGECGLNACAVC